MKNKLYAHNNQDHWRVYRVQSKALLDAWDDMGCLVCPFCGETEFDRIGLKNHLERHCSEWMVTKPVDFIRTREAANVQVEFQEGSEE